MGHGYPCLVGRCAPSCPKLRAPARTKAQTGRHHAGGAGRLLTSTMVWFPLSARSMQGPSLFSARESRNFLVL